MLDFNTFYRKAGIRNSTQLINPPKYAQVLFQLPQHSAVHYFPSGNLERAPDLNTLPYNNYSGPVYLLHQTKLLSTVGKPRFRSVLLTDQIRRIFISNRRFRRIEDFTARESSKNDVITVSYAFCNEGVSYMRTVYRDYYAWYNTVSTVFSTIANLTQTSSRNHFIFLNIDGFSLPPRAVLDSMVSAEKGTATTRQLAYLKKEAVRWFVEFWKFFSLTPEKSIFSLVPEKDFSKVNFVFTVGQGFVLVNLGKLRQWKLPTDEELKKNPELERKGFKSYQYQLYFFNMLDKLSSSQPVEEFVEDALKPAKPTNSGLIPKKADEKLPSSDPAANDGKLPAPVQTVPEIDDPKKATSGGTNTGTPSDSDVNDDEVVHADEFTRYDQEIEASIQALEQINAQENLPEGESLEPGESQDYEGGDEDDKVIDFSAIEVGDDEFIEPIGYIAPKKAPETPSAAIVQACDQLAATGSVSAREYKALVQLGERYKTIVAPDGKSTLEQFTKIDRTKLKVEPVRVAPDRPTILDKSMLNTTLLDFDKKYVREFHHKNVARMVLGVQFGGVALTGYEHEHVDEATGSYDVYSAKVLPVNGTASSINIKIPTVDDRGVFVVNNVKYRMRKQQFDIPFRKVSPTRIAFTSYYGKFFVDRTEKKRGNYEAWLCNQVMMNSMLADPVIRFLHSGEGFDHTVKAPRVYSALGMRFVDFEFNNAKVVLNKKALTKFLGEDLVKAQEKDGMFVAGYTKEKALIVIDKNDMWYSKTATQLLPLGRIEDIAGLDTQKAPVPYATIKVFGADIPLGVLIAYTVGLSRLLKSSGAAYKHIAVGQRYTLEPNEYEVVFADERLILSRENRFLAMLMAGFNEYHRTIRMYRFADFNKKAVYANVLEDNGLGVRYLREFILMKDMFIDPITKDWLVENKHATDFSGLLTEAISLLLTDEHPDEMDTAFMRFRGYERMSGMVYQELVKSMRLMRSKSTKASRVLDLNPQAVFRAIQLDTSVMPIKEINPIEELKDQESVTFSGTGGRTGRTMVAKNRKFHKNAMGVASEATPDNGDVGVNFYLSANPQVDSILGTTKRYEKGVTGNSSMVSTSVLLAPASDKDQARRANFISIQNSHTVPCSGYEVVPFRTGYEQVVPYRVSDLYCVIAPQDGVVLDVTDRVIKVEYKDKSVASYEIGKRFGEAAGMTIPHIVVTGWAKGKKFRADDVLTYHTGFFEKDPMNPGKVSMKFSALATVAFIDGPDVLEDASSMSYRFAKKMQTTIGKHKNIIVRFDQEVRQLIKEGTLVKAGDPLCVIEEQITSGKTLFSEQSIDTLQMLSDDVPLAPLDAQVDKIEVHYHGDLEDMSQSLKEIALAADKRLIKFNKEMGKPKVTGQDHGEYRVDGKSLELDTAVIVLYMSATAAHSTADKVVIGNQLKSVTSSMMSDDTMTEDGIPIDVTYSRKGVASRIVLSTDISLTTTACLECISNEMLKAYDQ